MTDFIQFEKCYIIEEDKRIIIAASDLNWIGSLFDKPSKTLIMGSFRNKEFTFKGWDGKVWEYVDSQAEALQARAPEGVTIPVLKVDVVNDLTVWTSKGWRPIVPDENGEVPWA